LIPSCLIQLPEGVERIVPIAVTDLATAPIIMYSLPLDVSSLQNLIQTFACIEGQVKVECGNENPEDGKSNETGNQSQSDMAKTGGSATESGLTDSASGLPKSDPI